MATLAPLPAEIDAAAPPDAAERRATRRELAVVTHATVRGHGEAPIAATLLDLSIYGCRLAVEDAPVAETRLWLRLDGGWPVPATVVWSAGDRIGCRFDQPIANEYMRRFTRLQLDRPRSAA